MYKFSYKIALLLLLLIFLTGCELFAFLFPPEIKAAYIPSIVYYPELRVVAEGNDYMGTITGWIVTDRKTEPDINDVRWVPQFPTYTLPQYGTYTLYVYAKNDHNLISDPKILTVTYKVRTHGNWTFMIWMDGDNNLESAAVNDFNEIEYGLYLAGQSDPSLYDKLTIITQFDRVNGEDNESHDGGADWTDTRRYLMTGDPVVSNLDFHSILLQKPGEINMGDADSLKDFITYCKLNYPSDHYALIMWNHGGGARSADSFLNGTKEMCQDVSSSDDYLYTGELTDVLTDSEDVDVFAADACYMGMVEVAYEYRPGAGKFGAAYFGGSPALEQFNGWKYNRVLNRLGGSGVDEEGDAKYDVAALTGSQLVDILVKEYRDYIEIDTSKGDQTFTALDLSKIGDVKTALDTLAAALAALSKPEVEAVRGSGIAPATLHYFEALYSYSWINQPHFDLYDFAERIAANSNLGAAQAAAQSLMAAVDACVISSYAGEAYNGKAYNGLNPVSGKHGLGFFFSRNSTDYAYQWWYTDQDTSVWGTGELYGKIDFCGPYTANLTVNNWRELLESWYDPSNTLTPGHY